MKRLQRCIGIPTRLHTIRSRVPACKCMDESTRTAVSIWQPSTSLVWLQKNHRLVDVFTKALMSHMRECFAFFAVCVCVCSSTRFPSLPGGAGVFGRINIAALV